MSSVTDPDPLRDKFIRGARTLLDRCYAHPGAWQSTRLVNPDPAALAFLAEAGIRWDGPDNVSVTRRRSGGLDARTRWARGFVRCLYHQHLYWTETQLAPGWRDARRSVPLRTRALDIEVGRALPGGRQAGTLLAPGRQVRVRVRRAWQDAAERAARRMPAGDRIWTDDEQPGARFSYADLRDWV